ncbi:MAG: hypothetical protein HYY08_03900 [Firmicutes bacterium]|nr:hypothetical protein [Bacillota bacterium]
MIDTRDWVPGKHPRLFFDGGEIDMLRDKRSRDEVTRAAWARLEDDAAKAMDIDLPRWSDRWEWDTGADNQKNLGTVTVDCLREVSSLGLSWLLDGVESHARKATDILMALCDFDFWTSTRFFGTDYRLPWRATLETAWICHAAGWGYDWLYNFMSEGERQRLRTCLLYKGILPLVQDWADPLTRLPLATHMLPWGNWWQNCIAPAGEALMSLYGEHPLTGRFSRLLREASDWFFRFEGAAVPDLPEELLGQARNILPGELRLRGGLLGRPELHGWGDHQLLPLRRSVLAAAGRGDPATEPHGEGGRVCSGWPFQSRGSHAGCEFR